MCRSEYWHTRKNEVTRATIPAIVSGAFFFFDPVLGASDPASERGLYTPPGFPDGLRSD